MADISQSSARLPFSKSEIEGSIAGRFEGIVDAFPDRIAVKTDAGGWTYKELNRFANRLADAVGERLGDDPQPVALLFDQGAPIVAAILGVLKAGYAYVALDPDHPPARIRALLDDLQTRLLLTDRRHLKSAGHLAGDTAAVLDIEQLPDRVSDQNPGRTIGPHAPAGIFYTSGTTGRPKGVLRTQQFILHRIWFEANEDDIGPEDRISLMHDFSYGASVTDTFNALLNGATLHLYDIKNRGVAPLIPWLKTEGISFFHAPVAIFRQFLGHLASDDFFPALRQITPSGRLFARDVLKIRRHVPDDCLLIQRLASTETGMVTRLRITNQMSFDGPVVPVGYPVADKEVFILDEKGRPLGKNTVGEIAVRSRYLASGYWGRPQLTRSAFRPDPEGSGAVTYRLGDLGRLRPDGCLELIGRKDSQVKIRGYRVEPREVEAALMDQEWVGESVVIARPQADGEQRLVAYIVLSGDQRPTISRLRQALAGRLPEPMIPARFVFLDRLPTTARGKIDRAALPEPGRARPKLAEPYEPPHHLVEQTLAEIWSTVLDIEPIGIRDSFFDLGGNSLQAAEMIGQVRAALEIELPLRAIYKAPTIEELARLLGRRENDAETPAGEDLDRALRLLGAT